jgi:hypothetical protein
LFNIKLSRLSCNESKIRIDSSSLAFTFQTQ